MTQFRTQPQHAHLLRALHERGLILPCAWDAVSARALQQAGSPTGPCCQWISRWNGCGPRVPPPTRWAFPRT